MKQFKKLIIFVSLVLSFVCVAFIASNTNNKVYGLPHQNMVQLSTDNEYEYSQNHIKEYIPKNGAITVTIAAAAKIPQGEKIIVSYKTTDYTAISALGDYTKLNNKIELTSTNNEAKITISVKNNTFLVDNHNNTFKFSIVDAVFEDGTSCPIDQLNNEIWCKTRAKNTYTTTNKNGIEFLSGYAAGTSFSIEEINRTDQSEFLYYDTEYTKYGEVPNSYQNDIKYLDTGIADAYLGGSFKVDSSHKLNWYDDNIALNIQRNNTKFYEMEWENKFDGQTMTIGSTGKKGSYTVYNPTGRTKSQYVMIPKAQAGSKIKFEMHIWDTTKTKVYSSAFDYLYIDTKGPRILNYGITDDRIVNSSVVNVMVRFNEPVQVINDTPVLYCKINSDASIYEQAFKYTAGSGTDTLVFSANASELSNKVNTKISRFVPYEITNGSNRNEMAGIYDYGYNLKCQNNQSDFRVYKEAMQEGAQIAAKNPLNIDIDLRTPSVSVIQKPTNSALKEHTAKLEINDASSNAIIYYEWTDSTDAPASYSNSDFNSNVSVTDRGRYTITSSGYNGLKYLHVKVVSDFGKSSGDILIKSTADEAIIFDNKAPSVSVSVNDEINTFVEKQFIISTDEGYLANGNNSGVGKVYMYYTTSSKSYLSLLRNQVIDSDMHVRTIYDSNKTATSNELKYDSDNNYFYLNTTISKSASNQTPYLMELLNMIDDQNGYNTFYIGFVIEDLAGNPSLGIDGNKIDLKDISFNTYEYDNRELFEISLESNQTAILEDTDNQLYAYLSNQENTLTITSSISDTLDEVLDVNSIVNNGNLIDIENVGTIVTKTKNELVLKLNANLTGYFEIDFKYGTKVTKKYNLYLSKTDKEDTLNKSIVDSTGEIINNVYQIFDSKFYYKNSGERVVDDFYYGQSKKNPTFSSLNAAKSFVEYYELQDLMLYEIKTQADADQLNSKIVAERMLAQGEKADANVGDFYIRYKKADWIVGDKTTSSWVYYSYSSKSGYIDVALARKNPNLDNAITSVVNSITANGEYTYLTDDNLDSYGAPHLEKGQYFPESLVASATMTESVLNPSISFIGDDEIYSNNITSNNYRLASNYEFIFEGETQTYTKIFYKFEGQTEFTQIPSMKTRLSEIANSPSGGMGTGLYTILELDSNGISIYSLYADCTAPIIKISTVSKDNDQEDVPSVISASMDGQTYNAKAFVFTDITDSDDYAYIAVYRVTALRTTLYKVFSKYDVVNGYASLENGYYLVMVYDRSGNFFSVYFKANDTKLQVNLVEVPNTSIRVECNRAEDEIQIYQIYRNNELVTSEYKQTVTFKEIGSYRIYIVDWFGNTYDDTISFTIDDPGIKWKYEKNGISYIYTGDESQIGMRMDKDDNSYTIYTNGILSAVYPLGSDYSYRFDGKEPTVTSSTTISGDKMLKINSTESYTIYIYYTNYPDIYVKYDVIVDDTPPVVLVATQEVEYIEAEIAEINKYIEDINAGLAELKPNGDIFVPSSIGYSKLEKESRMHVISNNGIVSSDYITVNLIDISKVIELQIYLDDKLIHSAKDYKGISGVTLTKSGRYRIVCLDSLGNASEFTFTNSFDSGVSMKVDDKVASYDDALNYGSNKFELVTKNDGYVVFLVTVDDYEQYYYSFFIENNVVRRCRITYVDEKQAEPYIAEDGTTKYKDPIYIGVEYNIDEVVYKAGASALYTFGKENNIDFTFRYDKGNYVFTFIPNKAHEYKFEAKYYYDYIKPIYCEAEFSSISSQIEIMTNEKTITLGASEIHYLNSEFTILKPNEESKVSKIEVGLSDKSDDIAYETIYDKKTDKYVDKTFFEEDVYLLKITNIHGIESEIIIYISKEFNIVTTAVYSDKTTNSYTSSYNGTIYSNGSIKFKSNNTIVDGTFIKNDVEFDLEEFEIFEEGIYKMTFKDLFGNSRTINCQINKKPFNIPDNLLTGFNDKAILKDKGYTSNLISIDLDVAAEKQIGKVTYIYNGTSYIAYDVMDPNHGIYTQDDLTNVIGKLGSGVYSLTISDVYGNSSTTTVVYKAESTLILSRLTRSSGIYRPYELELALDKGFHSNNSLKFETTANNYVFKVNGESYDLYKILSFNKNTEYGEDRYTIYYLDEYGYEYSFTATLFRAQVEINVVDESKFVDINNTMKTREPFELNYTEGSTCTYVLNDKEYTYTGGLLKKDGIYRFNVVDYAGNIDSKIYVKDSICEYQLYDTMGAKILVNGDISNNKRVAFMPLNQDSVKIDKVFYNGKELKDYNDDKFYDNGHWEILISDEVGNESYFEFYIISSPVLSLNYTTPYTYKVVSIDYTPNNDKKHSILDFVDQYDDHSEFVFGSAKEGIYTQEDGYYQVTMYSKAYGAYSSFSFTIDNIMPKVELVGCQEGQETLNNVSIKGFSVGDTIQIYRDGKLVKKITVISLATDTPVIKTGGKYKIVVTNQAGISQTLEFEKTTITNGAGSALIIIAAAAAVTVLFIGLVYRTKSRADK